MRLVRWYPVVKPISATNGLIIRLRETLSHNPGYIVAMNEIAEHVFEIY